MADDDAIMDDDDIEEYMTAVTNDEADEDPYADQRHFEPGQPILDHEEPMVPTPILYRGLNDREREELHKHGRVVLRPREPIGPSVVPEVSVLLRSDMPARHALELRPRFVSFALMHANAVCYATDHGTKDGEVATVRVGTTLVPANSGERDRPTVWAEPSATGLVFFDARYVLPDARVVNAVFSAQSRSLLDHEVMLARGEIVVTKADVAAVSRSQWDSTVETWARWCRRNGWDSFKLAATPLPSRSRTPFGGGIF